MRKLLIAIFTLFSVSVAAQPSTPLPEDYVRTGVEALRIFGQQNHTEAQARLFLNTAIAPMFDFEYMTDYALGPLAGTLKQSQRRQMRLSIQEHFLTTLANTLVQRQGNLPSVQIGRSRPRGAREIVVDTLIGDPQSIQIPASFRFYLGDRGWQIFDVVALGNSALMYYRQMLKRQLTRY